LWYDALIASNWIIPLSEIKTKVLLWQGQEDESVPLSMGKYMADKIRIARLILFPMLDIYGFFKHFAEVLDKLLNC